MTIRGDRRRFLGPFAQSMRLSLGLTQNDISEGTGFSVQTISKFENGHSNPLSYSSREIIGYLCDLGMHEGWDVDKLFDSFCLNMEVMERQDWVYDS